MSHFRTTTPSFAGPIIDTHPDTFNSTSTGTGTSASASTGTSTGGTSGSRNPRSTNDGSSTTTGRGGRDTMCDSTIASQPPNSTSTSIEAISNTDTNPNTLDIREFSCFDFGQDVVSWHAINVNQFDTTRRHIRGKERDVIKGHIISTIHVSVG